MINSFTPGGPEINHLFFDFLHLKEKKITSFMLPLFMTFNSSLATGKSPTKDQVASKKPQPDHEHPIFSSGITKGMSQEQFLPKQ